MDYYGDARRHEPASSIDAGSLRSALCALALLGDDPFLSSQAFNLAIVDEWLTQIEADLLQSMIKEDRTPIQKAVFVSAQSQMWIFAAYELLRTWRQRAKDIGKWASTGGLQQKLAALKNDRGFLHFGREIRAGQIEKVLKDSGKIGAINDDLKRTHVTFVHLEAIRISLAKHEVRRRHNSVALHPGYGRINQWCGALDYEIEMGRNSLGTANRRDIADGLRAIAHASVPSDDELADFDKFMRGPSDEQIAEIGALMVGSTAVEPVQDPSARQE